MTITTSRKDIQELKKFYSPKGPMSRLEGYEFREQQLEAALAVQEFLNDPDQSTFALEAPTGVGKTFAVLVPVLRSAVKEETRVLFLTASIALQEQLINKDLPRLRELLGIDFEFGLLKGRSNYVCLRRAANATLELSLFDAGDPAIDKLNLWLKQTETGDLAEDHDISPESPLLNEVRAGSRTCIGSACPFRNRCFIQKAYRAAQQWDVIVANYHLYFSHLLEGRETFPVKYDWLICDEAHRLPEAVRSSAVRQVFLKEAQSLLTPKTIKNFTPCLTSQSVSVDKILDHAAKIREFFQKLFDLAQVRLSGNGDFSEPLPELVHYGDLISLEIKSMMSPLAIIQESAEESSNQSQHRDSVTFDLEDFEIELDDVDNSSAKATGIVGRSAETGELINWMTNIDKLRENLLWCLSASEFPRWAYWADMNAESLASKPVASNDIVQNILAREDPPKVLFTSATIAVNSAKSEKGQADFAFWSQETGVVPDCSLIVDSPFNFAKQMEVLVGDVGLKVGAPGYDDRMCTIMEWLCDKNGGRTLVLLSSKRLMNAFAKKMRGKNRDYTVLVQGDTSHRQLLQRFLKDETSILIGSNSFREGIDVPGDSLTQVIIDRIPFPHPNDPMVKARDELEGGEAFKTVTLPLVRMSLRQEVGRLIRTTSDHGRVVLLDGRALSYKTWDILSAFPKCPCKQMKIASN